MTSPGQLALKYTLEHVRKAEHAVNPPDVYHSFLAGYEAAQQTNFSLKSATERPPEKVLLLPDPVIPIQDTDDIDWEQQLAPFSAYMDECQRRILHLEDGNSPEKLDGWISVKKQMPQPDVCVLICQDHVIWVSYFCSVLKMWGQYENGETCNPTHWMPLPKPPKVK